MAWRISVLVANRGRSLYAARCFYEAEVERRVLDRPLAVAAVGGVDIQRDFRGGFIGNTALDDATTYTTLRIRDRRAFDGLMTTPPC
ncbi:MAG: hypothetical protein HC923_09200 [Myxococcales bacterium]|nr:hypothetical protein [Myxococcales bacterium]